MKSARVYFYWAWAAVAAALALIIIFGVLAWWWSCPFTTLPQEAPDPEEEDSRAVDNLRRHLEAAREVDFATTIRLLQELAQGQRDLILMVEEDLVEEAAASRRLSSQP